MAIVTGTDNSEILDDTAEDDTIVALAGNDGIGISHGGTDSVDGGADNDRLYLDARLLGGGINMAAPTASADGLSGSASWTDTQVSFQHIEDFTIFSSAGSFADNVTTGAGDDIFFHYGIDNTTYAADTIDLGAGTSDLLVADFSAVTTHNIVGYLNFTPGHNLLTVDNFTKIDFTNVERLEFIGGALTDNVTGLDGNDILEGRSGNDMLNGAAGNDTLDGGRGNDTLTGGTGNDTFIIDNGDDSAAGGADSDTLVIHYGDATTAFSTNAGPVVNGGTGGFDGQYTIDATRRVAYSSIEHFDITTGSGNDTITTASGNDSVDAGSGDDLVNTGTGLDNADGGIGTDRISADMSAATANIGWNLEGNTFSGTTNTSFVNFEYFGTVRTGSGNDTIVTTELQQDETIDVGGGSNSVTVKNGRDDVTAGSGTDTLVVDYSAADTNITSLGASPPAGPQPSANGFDGYFGDLTNRFVNYHGFDAFDVRTGSGNDNITMGTGAVVTNDIVSLGSGDDAVVLGRGVDVADGGIGTDGVEADFSQTATAISVDLNTNSFSGPAGSSLTNFEYFYERDIGFATGSGNDTIVTRDAILNDAVRLGAGDDSVKVYGGTDYVVGFGVDTPAGQGGNDTLIVDYSAATAAVVRSAALQTNSGEGYDSAISDGVSRNVTFYGFDRFDITTGSGNDNLNFSGINTAADQVFHTNGGADTINLSQSTGTNFIDGGTGNDTMTGGSGNDTYVVDSVSDVVNDFFGGVDTIQTGLATFSLAARPEIENLTGIGNVDQTLTGNAAANVIDGGLGADNMTGGDGNDIYYVDNDNDQVNEGAGGSSGSDEVRTSISYTLGANVENLTATSDAGLTLIGNALSNVITGAAGGDILVGTSGDSLVGNGGDDDFDLSGFTYGTLSSAIGGDGGMDTLFADFSSYAGTVITGIGADSGGGSTGVFTDPAGFFPVNILNYFSSIERFVITGSAGDDTFTTGAGDDRIDGGGGVDTMAGGTGDDDYVVDSDSDTVTENAGEGIDEIQTSLLSYTLHSANVENLAGLNAAGQTLVGDGQANRITGEIGNDIINGLGGNDTMLGGEGDDRYFVDQGGDMVLEASGEGYDRVLTSVSYVLAAGSEIEKLTTNDNFATTAIDLTGNELGQYLFGNAGANRLDGAGGADVMVGLGGDDRYYIDTAADRVIEGVGEGYDRVLSAVSWTLQPDSHVDKITTIDNLATTAINLTGNNLGQYIFGNSGANKLDGGGGGDVLAGLGGNDVYVTRSEADRVIEDAGGGNDRVLAGASFVLQPGSEVEVLSTIDNLGTAAIDLTGNALSQYLFGNEGANVLDGKLGNDILYGFGGTDTFEFTTVLGAGNVDRIADFATGVDKIALDDFIFVGLSSGALPASAFHVGSAAHDADDRIIYDNASGTLYYDYDGSGIGTAVAFATLNGAPILAASDFMVI